MDTIYRGLSYFWRRYPPFGGWLSFFLLAVAVLSLASSFVLAAWVPEVNGVVYTTIAGLLLGTVLANRRTSAWLAWVLIVAYLLVLDLLFIAGLYPLNFLRLDETRPFALMVRQNLALLADRAGGWWLAVSGGGSSEETAVFALGLGLVAGLLAAYAAWSVYRSRRTLAGMFVLGLALAINGYFAGSSEHIWILAFFLAVAVLLLADMHFANQEVQWTRRKVDYSEQIRLELLMTAGGMAMGLMMLAFVLPTINIRTIAATFRQSAPVVTAEQTLERVFAGVRDPATQSDPAGPAGSGIMPRAFLLGNAPELAETVVMTATASPQVGIHWRAISYDTYTGRGWSRSDDRLEVYAAGERLPVPTFPTQISVTQQVQWVLDDRISRYSIGEPVEFDQPVTAAWRGVEDLVRVNGEGGRYTAISHHSPADAAALRRVDNLNAPPALLARYNTLPEGIPERVLDLAQEITSGQTNDFDKAVAIERFLRQYPYDLNVSGPPAGQDPVDYFLFDLQRGYCDYYASAMVVLARAAGLPARLAIGYLSQPPDEQGVQTIFHLNAHSWAEVYFAGHGWVEFEPTAAFPTQEDRPVAGSGESDTGGPPEMTPFTPPPIPDPAGETISPFWAIPLILLLIGGFYLFTRRLGSDRPEEKTVWRVYEQLQQAAEGLESAPRAAQTPAEFETALLTRVDELTAHPRPRQWLHPTRPGIPAIVQAYAARRYSPQKEDPVQDRRLWQTWQQMRRPLWLTGRWLALRRWFNRPE